MEQYFSGKIILVLFIISLIVISAALFIPIPKTYSPNVVNQESQVNEPQGESVSNLFKVERKDKEEVQPVPTDIPKEEACVLNGQMVRGGTVSSNTICVNESPSVTPKM